MAVRIAIPDMISPSYFPAIAAVELGYFAEQGIDASIELLYPVTDTYGALREGEVDYVGGAAHAALYTFGDWHGCKLICALSQSMYWFLVVRSDLDIARRDLAALRGLRIGAAPGPVDGLVRMLADAGIDPDEVDIGPVPGAEGAGVSFGVTAAKALEDGRIDGFWANGMGAEVAIEKGAGRLVVDARRGDGPVGAEGYTFPAMTATDRKIDEDPDETAIAVGAVVRAQRTLAEDPSRARDAARPHFPDHELELIDRLIERDAPFYDPTISEHQVRAMNNFARQLEILSRVEVPYEEVVATRFRSEWS